MRTKEAQGIAANASLLQARRHLSDRAIQNIFIWPTLLLLIAMNVFPLLYSLYLSFTNFLAVSGKPPTWVGATNFSTILNDPDMWPTSPRRAATR
jgi:multiple sugar transport system permease protein